VPALLAMVVALVPPSRDAQRETPLTQRPAGRGRCESSLGLQIPQCEARVRRSANISPATRPLCRPAIQLPSRGKGRACRDDDCTACADRAGDPDLHDGANQVRHQGGSMAAPRDARARRRRLLFRHARDRIICSDDRLAEVSQADIGPADPADDPRRTDGGGSGRIDHLPSKTRRES